MLDLTAALAWAGAEAGSPVTSHDRLTGGFTSRMLALRHDDGSESVLRLMTNEPWRTHGAALTSRERDALAFLAATPVPAPVSIALDADGERAGVAAHLMSRVPGEPLRGPVTPAHPAVAAMAGLLAVVHAQRPPTPFRTYQSWAWPEKWVVPGWTTRPAAWERAFEVLASPPPDHEPVFLHRDFGHRNLLWADGADGGATVTGVVDWVETSTGPAWLDAARGASTLAVEHGAAAGQALLDAYAPLAGTPADPYWLVMDAVGYLPPPGRPPLFRDPAQLARTDDWLAHVMAAYA